MPIKHPFNIYREQLWPLYHGFALWKPNPLEGIYNHVSVGDVGYIKEGGFIRMFNVTLPWDDESNKSLGEPYVYDPLSPDSFAIRRETFGKVDYYSRRVSREESVGNIQAASPDDAECVMYGCRGRGALLSLPNGGIHQEVIHTKVFQKYIGDNVTTWFEWSKSKGLPVKRMEDLVFVYGCTLVTSWAAAAFDDNTGNAQLSLASRTLNNGGTGFIWNNIRGTVDYHDSQLNPNIPYLPQNRCVFIKCLRSKRIWFWATISSTCSEIMTSPTPSSSEASYEGLSDEVSHDALSDEVSHDALSDEVPHDALFSDEAFCDGPSSCHEATFHASAEASHDALPSSYEASFHAPEASIPDDHNSCRGSPVHLTGVPDVPEYLDPLIRVLYYIAEDFPEDSITESAMAVAHDNDLQLIEGMDSLTGDAVENFLHENKIPVLLENDVMMLQYPSPQVNEHAGSDEASD